MFKSSIITNVIFKVILLSLVLISLITYKSYHDTIEILNEKEEILAEISIDPVFRRLKVVHDMLELASGQLTLNKELLDAFYNRDFHTTKSIVDVMMSVMSSKNIDLFHLHFPDGVTFYRGHAPEIFGDDLTGIRKMLDTAITTQTTVSGLEKGKSGVAYRIIEPVEYKGSNIGYLELGIYLDKGILNTWKQATGGEWSLFELSEKEGSIETFLLDSTEDSFKYDSYCEECDLNKLLAGEILTHKRDSYLIQQISLQDFKGDTTWFLARIYDNSALIQIYSQKRIETLIFSIFTALIFSYMLMITVRKTLSPLADLTAKTQAWTSGNLTVPIEYSSKNEIGQLAADMEKMRTTVHHNEQALLISNDKLVETNDKLKALNEKSRAEFIKAGQLHRKFLPKSFPNIEGFNIAVYYEPAEILGGDFYNVLRVNDNLLFYVVDVSGHGLDGALMNIFIKETIDKFFRNNENGTTFTPSKALNFLVSEYIKQGFPEDYHVAIFIGSIDLKTLTLSYSNAGLHIPPIISRKDGQVDSLENSGLPISNSINKELLTYESYYAGTIKNKTLLITTDGLVEQQREGEFFGEKRLQNIFAENYHLAPREQIEIFKEELFAFCDILDCNDDITLLLIQHN